MTSLLSHPKIQSCLAHDSQWTAEHGALYTARLCLKPIKSKRTMDTVIAAHTALAGKVTETCETFTARYADTLCVLPPGHSGACTHAPHKKLITNTCIAGKLDWIYTTPGDDDYIYKNRCSRLFPIAVPDDLEKQWRDKSVKLRCAIPLREASTPFLLATAYLDYLTLILHVEGIDTVLDTTYPHLQAIREITATHLETLRSYYAGFQRRIVDKDGFSICPVTTDRISVAQLSNSDIKEDGAIQLGHVVPRSETEFTIRGKNLLLMSREGNRIVGDNVFTEDVWLNRLRQIIAGQTA